MGMMMNENKFKSIRVLDVILIYIIYTKHILYI
jgi:hypothetical protein